ncbi:3-hydroxybutyryl-CoA dehydrogenase [Streptomyces sp. S1D4-11]|nr:3-hydroxybutyryl-CoA dehydrogenase [Streptomyces sp. S1D4-11]QIZ01135.1 3-hydroxybutyryl-CoA dehydrogenase [Streptomyces sp. S1D4-11]
MKTQISRLGVAGCGLMGSGIAEAAALNGIDVLVAEASEDAISAGRRRVVQSLDRGLKRGKLTEEARDTALGRITFTRHLDELGNREFIIEAVAENRAVKTEVLKTIDKAITDPDTIVATNTSSIPVIDLAMVTDRPDRVLGMHFFNPVSVQQLVELIPAITTSEETVSRARLFAADQLGKQVIQAPDKSGFIVNALLIPYLLAAVRMVESGSATAGDVDQGMELGCAHPMGPLRLLDLIGLDTTQAIAESMYEEFKEALYAPPALLRRMVAAGRLGRKSGHGFYAYGA